MEALERGGCRSIPTAEGARWALPPAVCPQSHPRCVTARRARGHPPTAVLALLLAASPAAHGAGTELVASVPEMSRVSSDLDVSLGWFSATLTLCLLDGSRDDDSMGSGPGSRQNPVTSIKDSQARLSQLCLHHGQLRMSNWAGGMVGRKERKERTQKE